jgi:hypothetical protein
MQPIKNRSKKTTIKTSDVSSTSMEDWRLFLDALEV